MQLALIHSAVEGDESDSRDLTQFFDEKLVLKVCFTHFSEGSGRILICLTQAYGIHASELNSSTLLQSVLTRIGTKDC